MVRMPTEPSTKQIKNEVFSPWVDFDDNSITLATSPLVPQSGLMYSLLPEQSQRPSES